MIIRRVSVRVDFILKLSQNDSDDRVCQKAREFLIEHAETIPMLYMELEPINEKKEDSSTTL